ncbi:MAG: Glycosyl transferase group 1 [uncultured bacterium]|nr:MAG: Glycosyl transferase group 1 [uncultured bacterium]
MQRMFEDERLRHKLAENNELKRFRSTYSKSLKVINKNSSRFWDYKIVDDQSRLLRSPIYRDKIQIIYKYLKNKEGKLLDIGFGPGHLEKKLSKKSKLTLFGLDISKIAVENARNRLKGKYLVGNIYKLPYMPASFDFILALDILEHLPPEKVFLAYKEIAKVLKDGGILVVSIPLNENLEQMMLKGRNPNAHLRVYTPLILKTELKLSGFKIVSEKYLSAFRTKYKLKSLLVKLSPIKLKKPNLLILVLKKNENTLFDAQGMA